MIGKILSEASHSIIGMLSAKPADMETRTAKNEFSSLLLPDENRPRPASGNAVAAMKSGVLKDGPIKGGAAKDGAAKDAGLKEGAKEQGARNDIEQFLSQFIGNDDPSAIPASDNNTPKTVGFARPAEASEGEVEAGTVATDYPPQGAQYIAALQSLESRIADGNAIAKADVVTQPKSGPMPDPAKHNPAQPVLDADTSPVQTQTGKPQSQPMPALDTGKQAPALSANPVSDNEISKAAKQAPVRDTGMVQSPEKAQQDTAPVRPVQDILGLRMARATRVDTAAAAAQQSVVAEAPISADAASKPVMAQATAPVRSAMKAPVKAPVNAELKSPVMEITSLPAAAETERVFELPAQQTAAPLAPAQNVAQNPATRTVSFDWNAPQFAERFASELADLNVSGDLKRFEINPRNMGRLELSFISRGGVDTIRIEAESDAARDVIVQHSQAIQDLLKANGRADLNLRVDVRDNMFAASDHGGFNPGQQNGANGRSGEQQDSLAPSLNHAAAAAPSPDTGPGPQISTDNSRYA